MMGHSDDETIKNPDQTRRRALDELITNYADPIIKRVILQRLHFYLYPIRKDLRQAEAEDLYQTVVLKLVFHLKTRDFELLQLSQEEIGNFIAAIAHNVCNDFLRLKYPERNRLKNKLRDLLRRNPEFASWKLQDQTLCGLAEWKGQEESTQTELLIAEIKEKGQELRIGGLSPAHLQFAPLSKVVTELLAWCRGPIEIDHLVQIVAALQGVKDQPDESLDDEESAFDRFVAPPSLDSERIETRELLCRIWLACCDLSEKQRKIFLLITADQTGESLLHRLVREQVATIGEIYRALNVNREELILLWEKLPMDAASIGKELGASARMVAKWRYRALKRLEPIIKLKNR